MNIFILLILLCCCGKSDCRENSCNQHSAEKPCGCPKSMPETDCGRPVRPEPCDCPVRQEPCARPEARNFNPYPAPGNMCGCEDKSM